MVRKKYEFRPDRVKNSLASRLFLTRKQRKTFFKWFFYGLLMLLLSVFQDVVMAKVRILGATTDLVPCGIFVICLTEGAEKSSIFCLIASFLYLFAGFSPGYIAIPALVILCMVITMFRQGYLRKGFGTILLCAGLGMFLYEAVVFAGAALLGRTTGSRFLFFAATALLSVLAVPVLYPITRAIEKFGGQSWKE